MLKVNDNQFQNTEEFMPVEVVSYLLSDGDEVRRIQSQLVLQCDPFLKGIKLAAITNMAPDACEMLERILEGSGISFRILASGKKRCLVFLYREEAFARYIRTGKIRRFLSSYGYRGYMVKETLDRLSERIGMYSREDISFPHEIGVFLDYPLRDVEGFIQNGGKDYLLSGYWKVYHNPERARKQFQAYDRARNEAVKELLAGKRFTEIVAWAA